MKTVENRCLFHFLLFYFERAVKYPKHQLFWKKGILAWGIQMLFSACCCPCCLWPLIARQVFVTSKQPPQAEESLSEQCWRWGNLFSQQNIWIFFLRLYFWDRWWNIIAPNIAMTGECDKVRERRSLFLLPFALHHWLWKSHLHSGGGRYCVSPSISWHLP